MRWRGELREHKLGDISIASHDKAHGTGSCAGTVERQWEAPRAQYGAYHGAIWVLSRIGNVV